MNFEHILILTLVVLVFLLGLWIRWQSGRGSRLARARSARAGAGEQDAEQLLLDAGYEILDRQVRCLWWFCVDGVEEEIEVRADLLVEKKGQRFVAEVKTGTNAPNPAFPPTRRQLLEYRLAFDPYGVLLIDMEYEEIMEVSFPRARVR